MPSVLIVTTADANYFEIALEMLDSLRSFPQLSQFATGVLDIGLTDAQRQILKSRGTIWAKAGWELALDRPPGMSDRMLAIYSRPFIPKYFPDFDLFVHLDGDTWVQDPAAVQTLIDRAAGVDAVVVPEMHVSYPHLYSLDSPAKKLHTQTFVPIYGQAMLQPANLMVLNGGVIAGRRDGRLWKAWQQSLAEGMAIRSRMDSVDGVHPLSLNDRINSRIEQNALNYAFYRGQISIFPLPAIYNWICSLCVPAFDVDRGMLVDPVPPFTPIQIVHLTKEGMDVSQLRDLSGQTHNKSLRWPDWKRPPANRPTA